MFAVLFSDFFIENIFSVKLFYNGGYGGSERQRPRLRGLYGLLVGIRTDRRTGIFRRRLWIYAEKNISASWHVLGASDGRYGRVEKQKVYRDGEQFYGEHRPQRGLHRDRRRRRRGCRRSAERHCLFQRNSGGMIRAAPSSSRTARWRR